MNPKTLKHPLLERYKMSSAVTEIAFDKLERNQAQQTFNTACETEAEAIKSIAAEGSLAVKVALEYHLQLRDLRKFAKTPADEAKIKQRRQDVVGKVLGCHYRDHTRISPHQRTTHMLTPMAVDK